MSQQSLLTLAIEQLSQEKLYLAKQLTSLTDQIITEKRQTLAEVLSKKSHAESILNKLTNEFSTLENNLKKRESRLSEREEKLRLDLSNRTSELETRENRLSEQEKISSEHLAKQRQEFESLRKKELAAIKDNWEQVNEIKSQLEIDRERLTKEFQERLEKTSASYINNTLESLNLTHKTLVDSADTWRVLGAIALFIGFCILLYASYRANPFDPSLSWLNIFYISLRGSALLLLVGAFTTYAAKTSSSRSEEAKIIAERIHAIDYGAFFLNTYGANASWEQIDSAFRHWHGNDNEKRDTEPEKRKPRIHRTHKIG